MRLTPDQRALILSAVHELAGPDACVRLFGSRLRDEVRGGDIDLMVSLGQAVPDLLGLQLRLGARLERVLGGRRVDLLMVQPGLELEPVHRVALAEGVELR